MSHHLKLILLLVLCNPGMASAQASLPLEDIHLPEGFSLAIYAEDVENARQMALGDAGTVFAGSRKAGNVYALRDADQDGFAEQVFVIDSGLNMPSGLAFRDGDLYVGAVSTILRYDGIENRLDNPPEPVVVTDALPPFPPGTRHGWKYLGFGPDGKLYVPVGAPCNVCDNPGYGKIMRMKPDGTEIEEFAAGVRNSVGITWHPVTGDLWFTDNGRDMMGDNIPSCELNHAPEQGMHFGFPFFHQGDIPDPEFGKDKRAADYTPPAAKLGPHVAPLGLEFYTGGMFPAKYKNQLFIAEHGSWNRSRKIGFRIKLVQFDQAGTVSGQDVFAEGWLQGEEAWGRPNDVMQMPDGALLISDDRAGVIYRLSFSE